MQELTAKQRLFVAEYLVDLNATQAAIRAGYSERTAEKIGHENLRKPEIAAAIEKAMQLRAGKANVNADRVLQEIAGMAFYDPADLVEIIREALPGDRAEDVQIEPGPGGKAMVVTGLSSPRDIKFLPEPIRRAIVGWGYDRNQNFTIKLADKGKALDQLARHLSLYNDKLEMTGLDALADRLERAFSRDA